MGFRGRRMAGRLQAVPLGKTVMDTMVGTDWISVPRRPQGRAGSLGGEAGRTLEPELRIQPRSLYFNSPSSYRAILRNAQTVWAGAMPAATSSCGWDLPSSQQCAASPQALWQLPEPLPARIQTKATQAASLGNGVTIGFHTTKPGRTPLP